jgi:hypothetical protein
VREAVVFMRSRLLPRRAALDDLAAAVESMPVLRAVPWYGESQFRRVLRWIFSRPPRVQTLVSLQAACNSRPVGS